MERIDKLREAHSLGPVMQRDGSLCSHLRPQIWSSTGGV